MKNKKFKAIFGNPPYSIKSGTGLRSKISLWPSFSETSIDIAEEVYYVTPHLWNRKAGNFLKHADATIEKVDLDIVDHFDIGTSLCYWNTHKKENEAFIISKGKKIYVGEKISDIKYIPYDLPNTLTIHQKGWNKPHLHLTKTRPISYEDDKLLLHRVQDEKYKYPVFSSTPKNLYYTTKKGIEDYGITLFNTPKIMMGRTKRSMPLFDRVGEYANTHIACVITDSLPNLEIRYKQLRTNFYKFWFATGRAEVDRRPDGFMYTATLNLFPDIPLSITEDADIYKWLGLTDEEIDVVEKYGSICDGKEFWWKTPKDKL